ncbi:uncharacterized protein LOC118279567 [Spodoptera frugiperda]|uniref:Uncharacterized protein LOC118279567 n=1 Tax=Spodoptera frugiperda TaxID=7108 RepID=A0A9R0DIG7_SPOFR|nr:uncharacterized protein LOC118279567 [Spodoptera frugiperda]
MTGKIIALVCLQFALFNTISAQCLNRIVPGCGQNILPMPVPVADTLLQNQVIIGQNYPPIVDLPYGMEAVLPNQLSIPATTIIQDSSVANNLANALQLLVVSNLLSNTLPSASPDVIIPGLGLGDYGMLAPYNPMLAPVNPMLAPINSVISPINSCGCGPWVY